MYDNSLSFTVVGTGSTSTSYTMGTGVGGILIVNTGPLITALTYNGVALTNVISFTPSIIDGNQQTVNVWRLSNPATGTNTLQATISPGTSNEIIGIVSYTGIDTTIYQPVENATGYSNNGVNNTLVSTLSTSVTTSKDRSITVMCTRGGNNFPQTFTAGTGTLRVSSTSILSNAHAIIDSGSVITPVGNSTLNATWTSGSGFMSNVVFSLSPVPTGGLLSFFP